MKNEALHLRRGTARAGVVALLGLVGALGGCVSQQDYDQLTVENRTLTNRNQELRAALDECQSAQSALSSNRGNSAQTIGQLQSTISQQNDLISQYESTIGELERQLQGISFGPLDAATDAALADLAASNPGLLTYDSRSGMLRFASDLTFASGSDQVSANAKQALSQLSQILKGSAASQYDLVIVGHTDSEQPSATTRQRHPTNMHLSAHRAISVRSELMSLGISGGKIQAAGWGEHRPLVPNTASGNTPANRRVEIYLGRSIGGTAGGAPAGASNTGAVGIDRDTPPDRQPAITK